MTVNAMYLNCVKLFEDENLADAKLEARFIIEKVLNFTHSDFILKKSQIVTQDQTLQIIKLSGLRLTGMPIQYVLGEWDFMGENFIVGEGVLIPRPETEILVQNVIEQIQSLQNPVVFDLCSGSGCIGISIKNAVPQAKVYLVEKSSEALYYLTQNVENFGFSSDITVIQGDILALGNEFDSLPTPDVIVSNPPYIKTQDIANLQSEVQLEPKMALDGGEDGYIFYEKLTQLWLPMIKNGSIMIECGEDQAQDIKKMFATVCGETQIIEDYNNIQRIVIGRKNNDN